jgi:hypothetical protein
VTGHEPPPQPVTFLGRRLPPWAQARLSIIPPGQQRIYKDTEWQGALVVVERGVIELECVGGDRWRFQEGDVLYLGGLPLRALHNAGSRQAVLSAVSRRQRPAR